MSALRKLAGQTAICVAIISLLVFSCSLDPHTTIVGKWVLMPSGRDTLIFHENQVVFLSPEGTIQDTSGYRIEGDSVWIQRGKHGIVGNVSFRIVFDGSDKFDYYLEGDTTQIYEWYQRVGQ